jgi:hypothetical protein
MRIPSSSTLAPAAGGQLDHVRQIGAHLGDGQRAQPVVAAQLQDDDAGMMQASARGRRARPPAVVSPLTLALTTW